MSKHEPVRDEVIYDLNKAVTALQGSLSQLWAAVVQVEVADMLRPPDPAGGGSALNDALKTCARCQEELTALQAVVAQWTIIAKQLPTGKPVAPVRARLKTAAGNERVNTFV